MKLEPIALSTIPDAIVEQIRRLVRSGNLKPGDRLPTERDLGEQFGVGRSSVREAMMALAAMGLVVRRREGTFVNPDPSVLVWAALSSESALTSNTIHDVFEARRIFEVGIVGLAAERATPQEIDEIRQWVPDTVPDVESFKKADLYFHAAIARAAGNPFITELYTRVQEILFQTHQYHAVLEELDPASSGAMYREVLEQHRAVLAGIEQHDSAAAQQAMLQHFRILEETMLPEAGVDAGAAAAEEAGDEEHS